jgi:hypothetical protein
MANTAASANGRKGLLLATMEPPANIEEEFQDWYDSEHFPERVACAGFETANRFVCVDGWPRYLAVYDLTDVDVLHGPAYAAIAIDRYSAWTHRIMSKVWGQYRAEGIQVSPGDALLGQSGPCARLLLWRFRRVPAALETQVAEGLRKLYGGRSDTTQVRLFRVAGPEPADYLALVELRCPVPPPDLAMLGSAALHVDLVNTYIPYTRKAPGAFPTTK